MRKYYLTFGVLNAKRKKNGPSMIHSGMSSMESVKKKKKRRDVLCPRVKYSGLIEREDFESRTE